MSKQALAVKYRPRKFSDVVEQDVPKSILTEQLKDKSFKNCLLFCGGAGTGKAQPLYSKVLTPNGFITMQEVSVGTKVITGNGNITKVSGVYPQGKRPIYEITVSEDYKFRVSDEHLNVIYKTIDEEIVEYVVTTLELLTMDKSNIYIKKTGPKGRGFAYFKLMDIEYVADEECQCIYVEAPEHTYITDNYMVTHNTTSARIFGKEINDFKGHIIEIDAASNNSVEDARRIIEDAKTRALDCEYKVFLLDEAHMLSTAAWNALLKLVEEPPKKSILLFCTTDPQKIPATILSRVQRFNFQKISLEGIMGRLKYIIESENKEICEERGNDFVEGEDNLLITYEDSAIEYIAKQADGGMRDSITLLDKCIGYNKNLTLSNVLEALGSVDYNTMFDLTNALNIMDGKTVLQIVENIHRTGMDLKQFIKQYSYFVLDLCKYEYFRNFDYLQMPATYESKLTGYTADDFSFFHQLLDVVSSLNDKIKYETIPKPVIESVLLRLCMEG